jgi:hypothetical protein
VLTRGDTLAALCSFALCLGGSLVHAVRVQTWPLGAIQRRALIRREGRWWQLDSWGLHDWPPAQSVDMRIAVRNWSLASLMARAALQRPEMKSCRANDAAKPASAAP